MKKVIIIFLPVFIISCNQRKKEEHKLQQNKSFEKLISTIDNYTNETLENGNINTISLAIYKEGKVYHNYYGKQANSTDSTHFEIASITKVFTGSLVAKAVLENKIKLEDDIRLYLEGDYTNLEFQGTPITIKNLLTHTLGFKDRRPPKLNEIWGNVSKGVYETKPIDYSIKDFLEELKNVELDKKPGTYYTYNSVGPEILAYILEQIYKETYENILDSFLSELDMKNTYLEGNKVESKYLIDGYDENGKQAPKAKNILLGGGGGMVATFPDLIKFMKFQLESDDPLIRESIKQLYLDREGDKTGYLWDVDFAEKEGFYYKKTGTSNGVQSVILICPDTKYGLILIANNTSEKAFTDWATLYNKIETELINYPMKSKGVK